MRLLTGLARSCWDVWSRFCSRVSYKDRSKGQVRRIEVGSHKELMEVRKVAECNGRRLGEQIAGRRVRQENVVALP